MTEAARRGIIVAISPERVMGLHGKIPWHYPADLKRFKRLTLGTTIVYGRLTWESIGKRPLPNRRNLVITSAPIRDVPNVESFPDIASALAGVTGPVWFCGGARIYEEAMRAYADFIDVTYVPDHVADPDAVRFPPIDPAVWEAGPRIRHEDDALLERQEFTRRSPAHVQP